MLLFISRFNSPLLTSLALSPPFLLSSISSNDCSFHPSNCAGDTKQLSCCVQYRWLPESIRFLHILVHVPSFLAWYNHANEEQEVHLPTDGGRLSLDSNSLLLDKPHWRVCNNSRRYECPPLSQFLLPWSRDSVTCSRCLSGSLPCDFPEQQFPYNCSYA